MSDVKSRFIFLWMLSRDPSESSRCSSWDVADTMSLQLVASIPWFSDRPLHSLTVGAPGPVGQDSQRLRCGLVVAQPRWEQCSSSLVESPFLSDASSSHVRSPFLSDASSFTSLSVSVPAHLPPAEGSLGRRADTSTLDLPGGRGSQSPRSSL